MYTVEKARRQDAGSRQTSLQSEKTWIGVGVLPPHVQETTARRDAYAETLRQAGATIVLNNVQELTPARILELVQQN